MSELRCAVCEKSFERTNSRSRYCSVDCRNAARRVGTQVRVRPPSLHPVVTPNRNKKWTDLRFVEELYKRRKQLNAQAPHPNDQWHGRVPNYTAFLDRDKV